MPYDKKPGSVTRMYSEKGKPAGLMLEGSVAQMDSPYKLEGPGDTDKKKEKTETKEPTAVQKLQMAGEALGKDVSFEVKTFEDPRSSRSIVGIKKQLKKEKPEQYKNIYGE